MKIYIDLLEERFEVDLRKPLDISIPIGGKEKWVKAWYVEDPEISPVKGDGFIGEVAKGGSVNFRDIKFNPHGHGTHTECMGHITKEIFSVNKTLNQYFFPCQVISINPTFIKGDQIISLMDISSIGIHKGVEAVAIRTLPNSNEKLKKDYSNSNPPYLDIKAIEHLVEKGIKHLLVDTPSVDREVDGGALISHNTFWNTSGKFREDATITEFIFIDDSISDGVYLLNLQVAPFENDASPSRPVLFKLEKS
jgi:arylformamidase